MVLKFPCAGVDCQSQFKIKTGELIKSPPTLQIQGQHCQVANHLCWISAPNKQRAVWLTPAQFDQPLSMVDNPEVGRRGGGVETGE